MRRIAPLLFILFMMLLPARADALTVRDVVELTRAGLGEELLLALIEVDRSVFPIDVATLKELKASGVSERVITAMVRSGREVTPPEPMVAEVAPPPVPPEPQVIVIEHREAPEVREVPVACRSTYRWRRRDRFTLVHTTLVHTTRGLTGARTGSRSRPIAGLPTTCRRRPRVGLSRSTGDLVASSDRMRGSLFRIRQ